MTSCITSLIRAFLCSLFFVLFSGTFTKIVGYSLSTFSPLSTSLHAPPKNTSDTSAVSNTTDIMTLDKVIIAVNKRQMLLKVSQSISIIKPAEWIGTNKAAADVVAEQTGLQTRQYGGTGNFQTRTPEWSSVSENTISSSNLSIYNDAGLVSFEGYFYIIEKFCADNILKFDPSKNGQSEVVYQTFLSDNWNPQDTKFVNLTKAYISNNNCHNGKSK